MSERRAVARPGPDTEVQQLHRDRDLLVLFKPAGLPTTRTDAGDCLTARARALDPDAPALHPLSRLDTQVTGLVAFARTKAMNRAASAAREAGTFRRAYVALAAASPEPTEGRWHWPIGPHPRHRSLRAAMDEGSTGQGVRSAHTRYGLAARAGGVSALWLWPGTGRTHQLRAHAARAGVPLIGDVRYGGPRRVVDGAGGVHASKRVLLHCGWLSLPRPGAQPLVVAAPAPADMAELWAAVGGERSALQACAEPA